MVETRHNRLLTPLVHSCLLITCRAGEAGAAAIRGAMSGRRSIIRLSSSFPAAWETLFHILFSIVPLPFCIVLCVFQSSLSLDRLGSQADCFGTSLPGFLEVVNLVDLNEPCLSRTVARCQGPLSHRNTPSWGLLLYPVARPWHKIPKLCYRHRWAR